MTWRDVDFKHLAVRVTAKPHGMAFVFSINLGAVAAHSALAIEEGAVLLKTKLQGADLTGANIYGISVWDIEFDSRTRQHSLVITPHDSLGVFPV